MSAGSRVSDRAGRPAMRSPGRPPAGRREHRQRFWLAIARGASSEDAAAEACVSAAVGVRWFREAGGMPSLSLRPTSGRYLSFSDREEIALLRASGAGVTGPAVTWIGRRHGRRKDRRWATGWSPEQIAHRLPLDFPDDPSMRISHEAIYQSLYVQGRGALRRELTACLRTG